MDVYFNLRLKRNRRKRWIRRRGRGGGGIGGVVFKNK